MQTVYLANPVYWNAGNPNKIVQSTYIGSVEVLLHEQ
jgi:hypothetical protein